MVLMSGDGEIAQFIYPSPREERPKSARAALRVCVGEGQSIELERSGG